MHLEIAVLNRRQNKKPISEKRLRYSTAQHNIRRRIVEQKQWILWGSFLFFSIGCLRHKLLLGAFIGVGRRPTKRKKEIDWVPLLVSVEDRQKGKKK